MVIKFYQFEPSAPCRAVKMTAKILNLPLEMVIVNLFKQDHKTEDYLQLNPTHTIPTIEDDKFVVWDSHAIVQYLVDKYGKNDQLYPKKFEERTLVNQMLFFETSVLFPALANAVRPIFFSKETNIAQDKLDNIESAFQFLENFLNKTKFIATNKHYTIADICAVATVSTIETFYPINDAQYPKLVKWLTELKAKEFYTENILGVQQFREIFTEALQKNQANL